MILEEIHYDLFETDAIELDEHPSRTFHELDREIRLVFADSPPIYVSWDNKPVMHSISYGRHSYFSSPAEVEREMTHSSLWSSLVGQEVELEFLDHARQALRIRASNAASDTAVYCCSRSMDEGRWWMDVVHVTADVPDLSTVILRPA